MSLATIIERSRRDREDWRYTNLEKLITQDNAPALKTVPAHMPALPSIIGDAALRHQIVFVNGEWNPKLSQLGKLPPGVIESGSNDEYNLVLEQQTCLITAPIELVFVTQNGVAETTAQLNIKIGPNARLTIVEHHVGDVDSTTAQMIDTNIHMGAQSKLVHGKILHNQQSAAHLARAQITVDEGGYYRNFALIKGTRLVRNEINVTLKGKLAQCALNGIMLLQDKQHADTLTRITHAALHGISRQLYKSIVKDQAHGVFQGRITVAEDAQKTDARQLSRALLLSDQAEMDAKPELQIFADDVSCAHGCTVGDLNSEALFYLRSRGLDEAEARALLLRGFIDEVIDEMHVDEWRAYARDAAGEWLNE